MFQFLNTVQPRYIIISSLLIAVLMMGSAVMELLESRKELFHLLQEHSLSLSETIANNSANIVLATDQIELQLSERLLNNALFIARLDSMGALTEADLRSIAAQNDIFRINIFSAAGERVATNHPPEKHRRFMKERNSPNEILQPILSGRQDRLVIGLKEARFEEGERYAVAVRRTRKGGGAIVLNLDAAALVKFRKSIGIGKLITDIGNNDGIEYVVLQDSEGILAATRVVSEMSSVSDDPEIATVLRRDTVMTRRSMFEAREVFEVIRRLTIGNATVGVLRIGLSMDEIRTVDQRMQRRLMIMAVVLTGLALVIGAFLVATRKYDVVSRQYERFQMMTGNILEHMRDAVITVNARQQVTVWNKQAEELFGVPASAVIGKRLPDLAAGAVPCLQRIFTDDRLQSAAALECAAGGKERTIAVTLSETHHADRTLESRTAVVRDLTDTKRLEMEIQRKDKLTAMGELASGVAHEIRNPLNAISMVAQRYEKEFTPRSGVKEYRALTRVLKDESSRVNTIIQQFLTFARPKRIHTQPVSSASLIDHVAALIRPQAAQQAITFFVSCEETELMIDREQMTQALLNLLQNALQATPQNGTVSLIFRKSSTNAQFIVKDTGTGIPEAVVGKIFDLYFTTKTNGTGIGLSITHQIVSQHGGTIHVEKNVPSGTIFIISLP